MGYGSYTPLPRGTIVGHDLTLFGGPIAHWSFNGTLVESITGGLGRDFTHPYPNYTAINPLQPSSDKFMSTLERAPGVLSLDAALKLNAATTVAGWFCIMDDGLPAYLQLWSAMVAGATSAQNAFWGIRVQSADNKVRGFWHSGARVDQAVTSSGAITFGRWYHIAFTRSADSSTAKLYFDGQLDATATGLSAHSDGASVNQIVCGHDQAGATGTTGVASVVLYNQELTAAEIAELYGSSISN